MAYENYEDPETQNHNGHGKAVFTGVLLGGVAGAITALLLAPQSGRETRKQIQVRVNDARDRATGQVEQAVDQIRTRAGQLKAEVGSKATELKRQGQDVIAEQLDRVSAAAEAGKKHLRTNGS